MDRSEVRRLIADTLDEIGLFSGNVTEILMGTCAQESHLGVYRKQLRGGPALGIFQMEPATFMDIYQNYLRFKPELLKKVMKTANVTVLKPSDLVENDVLAVAMARIHYLRVKEAIPVDLKGWAWYWKQYYNTPAGKGTEVEFIKNYKRFVL